MCVRGSVCVYLSGGVGLSVRRDGLELYLLFLLLLLLLLQRRLLVHFALLWARRPGGDKSEGVCVLLGTASYCPVIRPSTVYTVHNV